MSITYLELMLILPTKFHPDLFTLSVFQDSPFLPPAPPVSLDPVGVQNKSSETRGPFKIQSPVLKLKITQFSRINPPPPPQRDKIHSSYVNQVSRTCAYSSHQVFILISPLCVFQDFRFPRFLFPQPSPLCHRIRFELKTEVLRHKIFLYIKFH